MRVPFCVVKLQQRPFFRNFLRKRVYITQITTANYFYDKDYFYIHHLFIIHYLIFITHSSLSFL